MEVFHFLPESMGNVIVVSPALVAKSGGDFDIDKLTTFFPNLKERFFIDLSPSILISTDFKRFSKTAPSRSFKTKKLIKYMID